MYYASYEGDLKQPELGRRDRAIYNVLIAVLSAAGVAGAAVLVALVMAASGPGWRSWPRSWTAIRRGSSSSMTRA